MRNERSDEFVGDRVLNRGTEEQMNRGTEDRKGFSVLRGLVKTPAWVIETILSLFVCSSVPLFTSDHNLQQLSPFLGAIDK
jgi:hypothetical protein